MPQGAFKGKKLKIQTSIKKKEKQKLDGRKNKPIAPKKTKHEEAAKLKKIITKNVNRSMEEQIRSIASEGQKVNLSKKKDKTVDPNKMPPRS